jgi:hypothetical protein
VTALKAMSARRSRLAAYAVHHDPSGPRIRFGVAWMILLVVAFAVGPLAMALLLAVAGGAAALQLGGAWRRVDGSVNQLVAGGGSAVLPLAAWFNNSVAGVAVLVFAVVALVLGPDLANPFARRADDEAAAPLAIPERLTAAGLTLRCGLFVGVALLAAVQIQRETSTVLLFFVVAVSVYDAGHFLVGADARTATAGPIAGAIGVLVWSVAMWQYEPEPLVGVQTLWFGLLIALAAPAGELFASWLLPSATAAAPALRRIDSWLLAAPLFLGGLWLFTG